MVKARNTSWLNSGGRFGLQQSMLGRTDEAGVESPVL